MIKVYIRNLRMCSRKARLVANHINKMKNKNSDFVLNFLELVHGKAAKLIRKVVKHGFDVAVSKGYDKVSVSNVIVNEGKKIKRLDCRARGRRAIIIKKLSHVGVQFEVGS